VTAGSAAAEGRAATIFRTLWSQASTEKTSHGVLVHTATYIKQEIWANAHETCDSISLISYAGCQKYRTNTCLVWPSFFKQTNRQYTRLSGSIPDRWQTYAMLQLSDWRLAVYMTCVVVLCLCIAGSSSAVDEYQRQWAREENWQLFRETGHICCISHRMQVCIASSVY